MGVQGLGRQAIGVQGLRGSGCRALGLGVFRR